MEDNPRPILMIFAGPNGSGKSSNTEDVKQMCGAYPDLYINADEIALEKGLDAYAAAKEAERRREQALTAGISFVMETVMSSPAKLDLMQKAKSFGYHIHLEFVLTQDPNLNVMRVQNRVRKGGHDVPADKVIARYERSKALLPRALEIADTARVLNNSFDNPKVIARKFNNGEIKISPLSPPSKWNEDNIRDLLGIKKDTENLFGWTGSVNTAELRKQAEEIMSDPKTITESMSRDLSQTRESEPETDPDFSGPETNRPG